MKRLGIVIFGLAAGLVLASCGPDAQTPRSASQASATGNEFSGLRHSDPGELRISPYNDSR